MRSSPLLAATLAVAFSMSVACGSKDVRMSVAETQPAAQGKAELGKDDNGNTTVNLQVRHLARPQNLNPPKEVYVVWIQPRGQSPINQGALKVDDNLKGEFKARTSYANFDIFVTAEESATVSYPTGPEVMRQQLQRD